MVRSRQVLSVTLGCLLLVCAALVAAMVIVTPPAPPTHSQTMRDADGDRHTDTPVGDTIAADALISSATDKPDLDGIRADRDRASTTLTPEAAVRLGLEGLRHLHPASNAAEQELLDLACKGAWDKAVVAYRAYAADEPDRVDAALCAYLLRLRTSGLYIETDGDPHARRLAVAALDVHAVDSMAALVRAALFDADPDVVCEALWALLNHPRHDAEVFTRLDVLAKRGTETAAVAAAVLAHLRDGADKPVRPDLTSEPDAVYDEGWIPGPHAIHLPPIGNLFDVDSSSYTATDLATLREAYATGDENVRFHVARIVADHAWPAAFEFAVEMLRDSSVHVRAVAVDATIRFGSERSATALAEFLSRASAPQLRERVVAFVLAEESPALPATREIVFVHAVGDERTRERAIAALEQGHVALTAAAVEAIIEKMFRGTCPPGPLAIALRCMAVVDGDDRNVAQALREGFEVRAADERHAVVQAIASAFRDRFDDGVVALFALALYQDDEFTRLQAIEQLSKRFSPAVLAEFRDVCRTDTDAVVAAAIGALHDYAEHPDVIAFAHEQALEHRPAVEAALITLVGERGSIAMLPALLELCASIDATTRAGAIAIAPRIGDHRHVDPLSPLLADVDPAVVVSAIRAVAALLAAEPVDVAALLHSIDPTRPDGALRRVEDRRLVHMTLLSRLADGELNAAVWFALRFPHVRLRSEPQLYTGPNLAAFYAMAIGVPLVANRSAIREMSGPQTVSVLVEYADDRGERQVWRVPRDFYRHVLRPNTDAREVRGE